MEATDKKNDQLDAGSGFQKNGWMVMIVMMMVMIEFPHVVVSTHVNARHSHSEFPHVVVSSIDSITVRSKLEFI